ncbi:REGULATOR OF FATTY ACID COMPOSITION 3, chloroplastic-like protein [Drosera capensis]
MEAVALASTSTTPFKFHHKTLSKPLLSHTPRFTCFISPNGHSVFLPISPPNLSFRTQNRRVLVAVEAKKKDDDGEKSGKKEKRHSFDAKPDEVTGFFPEAVLLKEKKVEEDGKLLPEFADAEERQMFEYLNLQMESDLKGRMRHYEVVYLIHEDRADKVADVNAKVQEFLRENKGKVWRFSDWGLRRLAYPISKANNAHYILMNFEIEANLINDFKNMLDLDERVIRHLVIKRKKAITEYCPPPPEYHTLEEEEDTIFDDYEEDFDEEDFDEEDFDDIEDYHEDDDDEEEYEEEEEDDDRGIEEDDVDDDDDGDILVNGREPNTDNEIDSYKSTLKRGSIRNARKRWKRRM